MRNLRQSHDDRSLLAPRQIPTSHEPSITTCMRPVATPPLIASAPKLKKHLTHTKQTGKYFLIASFSPLFAVRAAAARAPFTDRESPNISRAISNRHTPGFRNFANPWKQTRNDFLTASNSAMSQNPARVEPRVWTAQFAGHRWGVQVAT